MLRRLVKVTARLALPSLLVLMALPSFGQVIPPAEPAPPFSGWIGILMGIVFAVGICIGCFMTPKRTHQD